MKRLLLLFLLLTTFIITGCSIKKTENTPLKKLEYSSPNTEFNYLTSENMFFITEIIPSPSLKNNKLGDPDKQKARIFLPPSYYKKKISSCLLSSWLWQ